MPFPDAQVQLEVESYASLKLARGKDAALAWLRPRLSHGALGRAAKIIYFRNCDELLWALYDQDDPVGSWETWIYRAAAYLREREPDAAHRALLERPFATRGASSAIWWPPRRSAAATRAPCSRRRTTTTSSRSQRTCSA